MEIEGSLLSTEIGYSISGLLHSITDLNSFRITEEFGCLCWFCATFAMMDCPRLLDIVVVANFIPVTKAHGGVGVISYLRTVSYLAGLLVTPL